MLVPQPASPDGAPRRPPRIPRPHPVERCASARIAALARGPEEGLSEGDFWRAVRREGTPLVEPDPAGDDDHAVVTFLWHGTDATRAVQVMPNKIGDPRDPAGNLMARVPGTHVWHWSVRMRRDWRATYTLSIDEGDGPAGVDAGSGGPAYWQWLRTRQQPDPFNFRTLAPRWGGPPVSYVELSDAPRGDDWRERTDVARGSVGEHTVPSRLLRNRRRVWVYQPPVTGVRPGAGPWARTGTPPTADGRLPVLVLLDGEMWQPRLGVATLLDNLIADGRIPPLVALLPESLGAGNRWDELTCKPGFVGFLRDELLPWATRRLPLTADPAHTVVAGQSLGGLTAAYAAVQAPGRFGAVLAQSGSFWWPDGPDAEWLTGRLACGPRVPVRFRLSAGEQEWVTLPASRRLRETLAARGYDASYREFNGGHDYLCWRTELADGLTELFAPRSADASAPSPAAPFAAAASPRR